MGMERIEPSIARKDVERRMHLLRKAQIRNTARKFKLQTLRQRHSTLSQHWRKTCRQIENGTYRRHVQRAQKLLNQVADPPLKEANAKAETAAPEVFDLGASLAEDIAADGTMRDAVGKAFDALGEWSPRTPEPHKPASSTGEVRAIPKPPPLPKKAASAKGPRRSLPTPRAAVKTSAAQTQSVKDLHRELTLARKKLSQSGRVSEAALAKTIASTRARLLSKHGADRRIEFRVDIKNGKAILKPIVK